MNTKPAVREGLPVVCPKHKLYQMRETEKGFIFCAHCRRNRIARDRNSILREVCGTSARAAREDMGL